MSVVTEHCRWNTSVSGANGAPPLVLLHGFAQSLNSFAEFAPLLDRKFRVIRIDLPGHGQTQWSPSAVLDWPCLCANLLAAIEQLEPRSAHWFGYSQGGRVALMCALLAERRVKSLALLGASPGIADEQARALRRESDQLLGQNIVGRGMSWFAEYWEALPIFANQKFLAQGTRQLIRSERMSCTPAGLKFALDNYGTGTMPDRSHELARWAKPLMLAAGELDGTFVESNGLLAKASASRHLEHHVSSGAGHAAHLEQPRQFAKLLTSFIHAAEGFSS
ncbi:MAG: alpha/beta fold hydrolase [bacterium]|nr:alpha/beta fold hydrolase [bacterium]